MDSSCTAVNLYVTRSTKDRSRSESYRGSSSGIGSPDKFDTPCAKSLDYKIVSSGVVPRSEKGYFGTAGG
jgi:hypothetical protein